MIAVNKCCRTLKAQERKEHFIFWVLNSIYIEFKEAEVNDKHDREDC